MWNVEYVTFPYTSRHVTNCYKYNHIVWSKCTPKHVTLCFISFIEMFPNLKVLLYIKVAFKKFWKQSSQVCVHFPKMWENYIAHVYCHDNKFLKLNNPYFSLLVIYYFITTWYTFILIFHLDRYLFYDYIWRNVARRSFVK